MGRRRLRHPESRLAAIEVKAAKPLVPVYLISLSRRIPVDGRFNERRGAAASPDEARTRIRQYLALDGYNDYVSGTFRQVWKQAP